MAVLALAACGGNTSRPLDGGKSDSGGQGDGGGGGGGGGPDAADAGSDGGDKGDGGTPDAMEAPLPPGTNPDARRLSDVRATLIGRGPDSCTSDKGGGDVWCGIAKNSASLGKYELWVINVTAAKAAGAMVNCMTGDANCKKLSDGDDFYQQDNGIYQSGFSGRTLIFHSDQTSGAGERFVGKISAWQPGWAAAQNLTTVGYRCFTSRNGKYGFCYDNLDTSKMGEMDFDWLAGELKDGGGALPKQDNVVCCDEMGVRKYQFGISPDEKTFMWSTKHAVADKETFYYKASADFGDASKKTMLLNDGSSRAFFSADSTKIFYMKDFNHDTMGSPSGALKMNTLPLSTPVDIDSGVGVAGALRNVATDADAGIFYYKGLAMGVGDFWMMKDKTMDSTKVKVLASAASVEGIAWSFTRLLFAKKVDSSSGLSDFYAIAIDPATYAPGAECTLTTGMMWTTAGYRSMTEDGNWAFWGGVGSDGKLSDLKACKTTDFGKNVAAWEPVKSAGFIENDDSDGLDATIRIVDLSMGTPAAPTPGKCDFAAGCIQKDARATYAVPYPAYNMVVYTIDKSSTVTNGIWVYGKLPWVAAPPPDAGTDTGATDTGGSDSAVD